MEDNDIFSNCISGVSLEGKEKNKKVLGEEPECQSLRAKGNSHAVHVSTLIFFGFVS